MNNAGDSKGGETKIVQGYEFDKNLKFNDDAVYVLATLRRTGVVYFEVDDGPTETVDQLYVASKVGYFDLIQRGHNVWVVESDRFRVEIPTYGPVRVDVIIASERAAYKDWAVATSGSKK